MRTFEARRLLLPEPPPPVDRPEPIFARSFVVFGTRFVQINFNQLLVAGPGSIGNWFPVIGGFSFLPTAVTIASTFVSLRVSPGIPVGGPDRVTYFASPPNVKALDDGADSLPFDDFPIT